MRHRNVYCSMGESKAKILIANEVDEGMVCMDRTERLKIHVIMGTTRPNRFGEKPARWIFGLAKRRDELDVELIDLRDYPLPFYDWPGTPLALSGQYTTDVARQWAHKVEEADGYIVVTAEYNHGYPAVLKNALDYVYKEWNNKAVGFVGYGNAGGARAIEQLRQVAVELRMVPIKTAVHLPVEVYRAARDQQEGDPDPFLVMKDRAEVFLDELTAWVRAAKFVRDQDKTRP